MGLNGCCFSGFNSTHVDMAPDFAGTLMGMTNSIGNIPGFVAPLVAASFYDKGVRILFEYKLNLLTFTDFAAHPNQLVVCVLLSWTGIRRDRYYILSVCFGTSPELGS